MASKGLPSKSSHTLPNKFTTDGEKDFFYAKVLNKGTVRLRVRSAGNVHLIFSGEPTSRIAYGIHLGIGVGRVSTITRRHATVATAATPHLLDEDIESELCLRWHLGTFELTHLPTTVPILTYVDHFPVEYSFLSISTSNSTIAHWTILSISHFSTTSIASALSTRDCRPSLIFDTRSIYSLRQQPVHTNAGQSEHFYYKRIPFPRLNFWVKTEHSMQIALTDARHLRKPHLLIGVAVGSETRNFLNINFKTKITQEANGPSNLNKNKYTPWYVCVTKGHELLVGPAGSDSNVLLSRMVPTLTLTHFGVCTGFGSSGDWLLDMLDSDMKHGEWVTATNGEVPDNAVPINEEDPHKEQAYIARALTSNGLDPGLLLPSTKKCFIPTDRKKAGGTVISFREYQVLCSKHRVKWSPLTKNQAKTGAICGGVGFWRGEPNYIVRKKTDNGFGIGSLDWIHLECYVAVGEEVEDHLEDCEILMFDFTH